MSGVEIGATGDRRVDEALRPLESLDGLPVHEHAAVVERVHRSLQDRLTGEDHDADEDEYTTLDETPISGGFTDIAVDEADHRQDLEPGGDWDAQRPDGAADEGESWDVPGSDGAVAEAGDGWDGAEPGAGEAPARRPDGEG